MNTTRESSFNIKDHLMKYLNGLDVCISPEDLRNRLIDASSDLFIDSIHIDQKSRKAGVLNGGLFAIIEVMCIMFGLDSEIVNEEMVKHMEQSLKEKEE